MRDKKNIICDVNNARYKNNLYKFNMSKKDLLKYLYKLINNCNSFIYNSNDSKLEAYKRNFYATRNFNKSFSYAYRLYSKEL